VSRFNTTSTVLVPNTVDYRYQMAVGHRRRHTSTRRGLTRYRTSAVLLATAPRTYHRHTGKDDRRLLETEPRSTSTVSTTTTNNLHSGLERSPKQTSSPANERQTTNDADYHDDWTVMCDVVHVCVRRLHNVAWPTTFGIRSTFTFRTSMMSCEVGMNSVPNVSAPSGRKANAKNQNKGRKD
jgi:hypothetical protein